MAGRGWRRKINKLAGHRLAEKTLCVYMARYGGEELLGGREGIVLVRRGVEIRKCLGDGLTDGREWQGGSWSFGPDGGRGRTDRDGKGVRRRSSRRPSCLCAFSFCIGPLIYSIHPSCCRCSSDGSL